MPVIVGFITGLAAGVVTFLLTGGGILGMAVALLTATLAYLGVSSLLTPTPRIGGAVAELIPDGDKALAAINDAKTTLTKVASYGGTIRDGDIRREIHEFTQGMHALTAYVEREPSGYEVLRHYNTAYGAQVVNLLDSYRSIELAGIPDTIRTAKAKTIDAMNTVEATAAKELDRAVRDKRLMLDANASAIRQLTAMDGYQSDHGGHGPSYPPPGTQPTEPEPSDGKDHR